MLHKRIRQPRLLSLVAAVSGVFLILAGAYGWQRTTHLQQQTKELNARIAAVNRNGLATADLNRLRGIAAQAAGPGEVPPEFEYAILYRQWLQAMVLFDRLEAARDNPYLDERARHSVSELHAHLLQLRDATSDRLAETPSLPLDWQWKMHSLKGNIAVLLAYSVLYHEEDGRKAAKLLGDALNDYKTAIEQVDRVSLSAEERALPRWNLELIVAIGEYRRVGLSEIPAADMSRVQNQLQTYIPQAPGFSPGAPVESRVEK